MNYYGIILSMVLIAGIAVIVWGWKILSAARRVRQWPIAQGIVKVSELRSVQDDLLPDIEFAYIVSDKAYQKKFKFPAGMDTMPELAESYRSKYPVGSEVSVYYNPANPEDATLEPSARGDWMVMTLGILITIASLLALLI